MPILLFLVMAESKEFIKTFGWFSGGSSMVLRLLILLLLFVVGCAVQVPPPDMSPPKGNNETAWLYYYDRMFEVYGNKTLPPSENDPDSANVAYMKAYSEWKADQRQKERKKIIRDISLTFSLLVSTAILTWGFNQDKK